MQNLVPTIAYLFLVLAVCEPGHRTKRADFGRSKRDFIVSVCALASTLALPWSGVSFLTFLTREAGLPTGFSLVMLWFPLVVAAMLATRQEENGDVRGRAIPIFSLTIAISSLAWFTRKIGVPGDLCSVENLSAVFRLESIRSERLIASMLLLAVGLLTAFAQTGFAEGRERSLLAFSYAGFLVNVFVPLNMATLAGLPPHRSIVVDAVSLFVLTLFTSRLVLPSLGQWLSIRKFRGAWGTPLYFVCVGCYFIVTA